MVNLKFFKKTLIYFLIFIIVPIIGTLLHECGHWIAGKLLGCEPIIRYAFCSSNCGFPLSDKQYFIFILGGPLATWIQSLIPLSIIIIYYRKQHPEKLEEKLPPLFVLLLGFVTFSGRFVFNAGGYIFTESTSSDEYKMEIYLGLPHGALIFGFAIIGLAVLLYSLFIIAKKNRSSIFIGAIGGAVLGYLLWYYYLGPLLIP
ncbi:MAG: hypothetical protein GF364_12225 [Candidatus Lokiarchaeota archaeon]|nr:hypothetical protein [Candidatus Lokiarchaeota archaeon]